ncbi:MAG TPA: hypothetical protein VFN35_36595, partial [Ktedonobacteraceae bacterium]|nr:hypothetical protein [Ktedonobacteraceae bacterium]
YSHRLERYPYNASNCFWLACVFSLLKEKEQALECLARAIDLNRDYQEEAENEEDLAWLRQDEDFLRLIEA